MPKGSGDPRTPAFAGRPFLFRRMHCSNWRFALFLLIMSGFWTSFNQIFYTMPEYIRDFVDTRPAIVAAEKVFGKGDPNDPNSGVASKLATINELERGEVIREITELKAALAETGDADAQLEALEDASRSLLHSKVRMHPDELREKLTASNDVEQIADQVIMEGRQINPEFIVNINAGAIVIFQVLISFMMARFHRFTTMIVGMLIAAVGIGLSCLAGSEGMIGAGGIIWVVAGGIFIFSFGEMMASPTSQEYVGRIAPKGKTALYMGYYFVAVALGNLFGGILSGELMQKFTYDMGRPDYMWMTFGGIMAFTALIFLMYNRMALPRGSESSLTEETA
jgi:dipeptide/tripeptide permease